MNLVLILLLIGFAIFWFVIILSDYIKGYKRRKEWESLLAKKRKFEERKKHIKFRPDLYETIEEFKRAVELEIEIDPISYYGFRGNLRGNKYMFSNTLQHYYYLNDQVVLLELKNIDGFISKNITVFKFIRYGDIFTDEDLIKYNANNYEEELNSIINKFNQGDKVDVFTWERNDLLSDLIVRIKNENGGVK